jgi:hypothetical protein
MPRLAALKHELLRIRSIKKDVLSEYWFYYPFQFLIFNYQFTKLLIFQISSVSRHIHGLRASLIAHGDIDWNVLQP